MKKRRVVLQSLDGSHLFISNQAAGQARGHHGKSSDQTDKESRDCQDKHGWLDAACIKYQDNLTSLDAGCRKYQDNLTCLDTVCMKCQDNLTGLNTGCITWLDCQDNLTCLDVKTVETILIVLTGQHYIVWR